MKTQTLLFLKASIVFSLLNLAIALKVHAEDEIYTNDSTQVRDDRTGNGGSGSEAELAGELANIELIVAKICRICQFFIS